jgi:hypothetical protein
VDIPCELKVSPLLNKIFLLKKNKNKKHCTDFNSIPIIKVHILTYYCLFIIPYSFIPSIFNQSQLHDIQLNSIAKKEIIFEKMKSIHVHKHSSTLLETHGSTIVRLKLFFRTLKKAQKCGNWFEQ